jgi:hydroxymethylpyrimidine pyrophosphatase-like HAD family hydrolase
MADRITEPALKFTIDCMNMSALKTACSQVDDIVFTRFSGETWIAVAKIGAQKHLALTAVMKQLGIASSEIAVFGDDYNDIDILSLQGVVSVAVDNAIDEVKAIASQVCGDCDKDGVAKWLEENVL